MVAQNKKARHDYHIEDTCEAGLVLVGTEVKSLRMGRASLVDGFAEIDDGEAWLHGVHIPEYSQGTWTNHAARRKRKLLLNRLEIDKIERKITDKGYTIVPLALYFKDGRAKVEIALAEGQEVLRQAPHARRAQANREKEQAVQRRLKGIELTDAASSIRRRPRPARALRRPHPLPAAAGDGQGARPVRRRRSADRSAVADALPRRATTCWSRRCAPSASAASPRCPTPTSPTWPSSSTTGPPASRSGCPRRCVCGTFFPEPGVAGVRRRARSPRASRSGRCTSRWAPSTVTDPLLDEVWGLLADAGTPVVLHAGSGPVATELHRPGPGRGAAGRGTRGCGW